MKPTFCQCCSRKYETPEDYLTGTSRFRVCSKGNLWFECSCGTSLILMKDDYEWYSPTLNMSEAAATVFKSVKEISSTPLIPSSVINIQNAIANDKSSPKDLKNVLRQAPNLALSVIKTANRLRVASDLEITDLEQAITCMDRKTLSDLILAETIQDFDFLTTEFRKDIYWEEAILTGKIAEYLVHNFAPHLSKDHAYIAGSLCNVGKIVAAICFPEVTDNIAKAVRNPYAQMTWTQAEEQLRAISHTVLGEVAATLWGFPEYVVHSLSSHHLPPEKVKQIADREIVILEDDDSQEDLGANIQQIVALANQYTHWVLRQPSRIDEDIFDKYTLALNFDAKERDQVGEALMQFNTPLAS